MKKTNLKQPPLRLDKIEYYSNLPTSQLILEADHAEKILSSVKDLTEEKLLDSRIILKELNTRLEKLETL